MYSKKYYIMFTCTVMAFLALMALIVPYDMAGKFGQDPIYIWFMRIGGVVFPMVGGHMMGATACMCNWFNIKKHSKGGS